MPQQVFYRVVWIQYCLCLLQYWSCCLFIWLFDISLSSTFLFVCFFQGFLFFILCSLLLSCDIFCGFWFAFSAVHFSLNHSTFYFQLIFGSKPLLICILVSSVSIIFLLVVWNGTLLHSLLLLCQCFWLFQLAPSCQYFKF